jgi:hypothetical protein
MRFLAFFFGVALVLSAEDYALLIRNARVEEGKLTGARPGKIVRHISQ